VDWPGRGPTWLGVPALLVAIVGGLILNDILDRQAMSRHLLADGVTTRADTVELNVYPGKGSPFVGEVFVRYREPRRHPQLNVGSSIRPLCAGTPCSSRSSTDPRSYLSNGGRVFSK
jgi:hypothetical protein